MELTNLYCNKWRKSTKLNGSFFAATQYTINGFGWATGVNTSGYLLLGPDCPFPSGGSLYNNKGAYSMLHLNGTTSSTSSSFDLGYRPWMKIGVFFSENSDMMYVGRKSNGSDQTDAVVSWSDDGFGPLGPDNMRFIFSVGNAAGTGLPNGDLNGGGMDGREIMRMNPLGNVGVGPRFNNLNQPTSTYHQHQEQSLSSWMQITNQRINGGGAGTYLAPTPTNANFGFRWGILGDITLARNANAFIYNQEKRHIVFSTGNPVPTNISLTNERMRITAIENPTFLPTGGGYGVYSPAGLSLNTTRVAISENPTAPIIRPMSLLHLGFDVGYISPGSLDGWRPWMDIGTFTSSGYDNMYVGLKQEGFSADRNDAVINWGDNQTALPTPFSGVDNLRFIFTANTTAIPPVGAPPATSLNGLEVGRFFPGRDTLGLYGRFGVGDFTASGVNQDPTHKLDVVGNGRFRLLPDSIYRKDTLVQKIVFVDSSGVLRWEYADSLNLGQGGNACGAVNTNPLTSNWELPMNDFNYHFSDGGSTNQFNNVGIGTNCGALTARLQVVNPVMTVGIDARTSTVVGNNMGVRGTALNGGLNSYGVYGQAVVAGGTVFNTGVYGRASNSVQSNYGGQFYAFGAGATNMGIQTNGTGGATQNYGVNASANGGVSAIGVSGQASVASLSNYGVLGTASTSNPNNRAGKFVGVLESTSGTVVVSDQMFKINVTGIKSATEILRRLKPHTYKMDVANFPQFNFTDVKQYGFIAQEIETILPELVQESVSPEEKDSLGNIIHPAISYKALNYDALIPIAVEAINELGGQYEKSTLSDQSIKTNVQNLSGSLAKVKQMRGVTYEWSTTAQDNMELDSLQHVGFIAQEISAIEPLLTFVDDSSLMHVNYDRVVPMLVESIKDLDAQIQTKDSIIAYKDSLLDARITVLENALNACCNSHSMQQNNSNNSIASQDVELKDGQAIVLEQNVPNPFAEQTTINYFLPDNVVKAQMLFYNAQGKLIQSVDLNEKGKGSLNVFAQDLSNGIYTYTLVVDGKIVETKKMVKQQ